jgi:hypothetical protein
MVTCVLVGAEGHWLRVVEVRGLRVTAISTLVSLGSQHAAGLHRTIATFATVATMMLYCTPALSPDAFVLVALTLLLQTLLRSYSRTIYCRRCYGTEAQGLLLSTHPPCTVRLLPLFEGKTKSKHSNACFIIICFGHP